MSPLRFIIALLLMTIGTTSATFHRVLSNKGTDFVANATGQLAHKAVHKTSQLAENVIDEIKKRASQGHRR
tara:strand:+ start:969 stop:1181 length:213 start_codon:yes stop_codon:yes gene_type:complete